MLLKTIYRLLAFDRRRELLDDERWLAEFARHVWEDVSPASLSMENAFGGPPRIYAQTRMFMKGNKVAESSGNSDQQPARKSTSVRGVAEGLLRKRLPPAAQQLLTDALVYGQERRAYGREPFVHPAVLLLPGEEQRHSAFIRDVSVGGIGLLHFIQLDSQRITVQTRRYNDDLVQVDVDIAWCVPCGQGCYMSGGTFVTPWLHG